MLHVVLLADCLVLTNMFENNRIYDGVEADRRKPQTTSQII